MKLKMPNKRTLKYGSFATALTAGFIVVIVLFNVIVTALSAGLHWKVDLTSAKLYNITPETVNFLKDLAEPITITVLDDEVKFAAYDQYYYQVNELLHAFERASDKVTLKYVNVINDPTFQTKYPNLDLSQVNIIVESPKRAITVAAYDLFDVQQTQDQSYTMISSIAEQVLGTAIMNVESDTLVKVGVTSGFGEQTITPFTDLLTKNNYNVVTVDMASGQIDPAIDVLIIPAPARDYDESSLQLLDKFLTNGTKYGKKLLYFASSDQLASLPNLEAFLAEWGIGIQSGSVFETNSANWFYSGNNYSPFLTMASNDITDYTTGLRGGNQKVFMPYSRPLKQLFTTLGNVETTSVISLSKDAAVMPAGASQDFDPSTAKGTGPYPVLIRSVKTIFQGSTAYTSYVFACGSIGSITDSVLSSTSFINAQYYVNMFNVLTDRQSYLSVTPKSMTATSLNVSASGVTTLGIIFILILPLLTIGAGTAVWFTRRHR